MAGMEPENMAPPVINDAICLVPVWQQMQVGQNMVMGCVAIPACMEHIEVKEMSPIEKAVQGGRIIPGGVG
jgi:hypothetical protein